MEQKHIYYFDFESIMSVKKDITPAEEIFADEYLKNLIVEVVTEDEKYPLNDETIRYWVVNILRYHQQFNL